MARFSIDENGNNQQEQHSYPTLPLAKLQKLETLSLYYNLPEAAIICTKCGFALSPKRASEHPGKKHGIARSAPHGLKPLLSSLNLPDPDTLALTSDGSRPHPYLMVQVASSCKHCGLRSASEKVLADHLRAKHRDKLELATGKQTRQHRLRDHIQQGVLFQSWTFNNTRRSWLVGADRHFGGRSVLILSNNLPKSCLQRNMPVWRISRAAIRDCLRVRHRPLLPSRPTGCGAQAGKRYSKMRVTIFLSRSRSYPTAGLTVLCR
ncbi:hypothetical protein FSOLCH5_014623 [Fusarium solani]